MEERVERQAMGHQVAAIGGLAEVGVVSGPCPGAAEVGQNGRGAGEELEVDRGVDALAPHPEDRAEGLQRRADQAVGANADDVGRRDHVEEVEDEAIL